MTTPGTSDVSLEDILDKEGPDAWGGQGASICSPSYLREPPQRPPLVIGRQPLPAAQGL